MRFARYAGRQRVRCPIKTARGFGLLEVLISILVLAIGLLSIAALHVTAIRHNGAAQDTSIATLQIQDMAERMRSNPGGVSAGSYNAISTTIPGNPGCTTCTPAQQAQLDAFQWNTDNLNLLPAGRGSVTGNGTTFTVTIYWDQNRTGATGTGCSNNSTVDLTCARASVTP